MKTFMGISIFKPRFCKERSLISDIKLIEKYYTDYTIIIADIPELWNLTGIEKKSFNDAQMIVNSQTELIENFLIKNKISNYIKWDSIENELDYFKKRIDTISKNDAKFIDLLSKTIDSNLSKRYSPLTSDKIIGAIPYLISELAQTWYFFSNLNYELEIYPAPIPRIKKYLFNENLKNEINYSYQNLFDLKD